MVSFTLQQTTSIVQVDKYQVANVVVTAVGADPNIYVFKTSTQCFSHYATAADMTQWPTDPNVAAQIGASFYRLPAVTRVWDTVKRMNYDLSYSLCRAQSLANEINALQGPLVGTTTTTVTSC